ncbi:MAG TPA: arylsulfotransferase family protein [Solirubrobacteraceae bacterium]|nr:arylsulfotransferase family protein [Solirubrobacteraceae bacterium]
MIVGSAPWMRLAMLVVVLMAGLAASPAAASADLGAWSFQTAPALTPPRVEVLTSRPGTASGLVFLDPFKDFAVTTPQVGQSGALVLDNAGDPVWFRPAPAGQEIVDFRTQALFGRPVLTWWQGALILPPATPAGVPEPGGAFYVYDQHYREVKRITARNGFIADPHELILTSRGTAIFPAVKDVAADLSPYGGSATGHYEDNAIQEIDLKTGKLVFSWDMASHIPLSEAEVTPAPASAVVWDPYHINSIDIDATGHLLISARDTWGLYEISRHDGHVVWRLGGKNSTFAVGKNADFSWQHDARYLPGNEISLFDDSCCSLPLGKPARFARGLVLKLSSGRKTATVARSYTHNPGLDVPTQGSMQTLPGGHVFIGWGQQPLYSEYTAAGKLLYDARLPNADESYRTLRLPWVGKPLTRPSIAVRRSGAQAAVYASWNGATAVASWKVLAGPGRRRLAALQTVARHGFETTVRLRSRRVRFEVQALDARGRILGTSALVKAGKAPKAITAATGTSVGTHKTKLGSALATSSGHMLYLFTGTACTGGCAKTWKPLIARGSVSAVSGSGVNAKLLATSKRSDGRVQVTYNHHPLYTDVADTKAGDMHGEGASEFGGRWYVVNTKGNAVKPKKAGGVPVCNPLCGGY